MNIKPLFDRVLILPDKNKNVAGCGLVLPEISKEKPQTGIVVNIGSEVKNLNEKDHVIFNKYAGVDVSFDGEDYLILKEIDIVGVLNVSEEN